MPFGKYHEQHCIRYRQLDEKQMLYKATAEDNSTLWYLRNGNEIARIPFYVADTLEGQNKPTFVFGPYIFLNGFERTEPARYLMQCCKYKALYNSTRTKIEQTREMFRAWIVVDHEYEETLNAQH